MSLTIEPLKGEQFRGALPALARLRIEVFRDWPYLYDGSLAYEQDYLEHFAKAEGAVIVVARDAGEVVGAATGSPLMEHTARFASLFAERGFAPERIFYCGESVLRSSYRGHGLGHAFFDRREAHARGLRSGAEAFTHSAFCGVVRPDTHPLRPADYRPLDGFWAKRGYAKVDGMLGSYEWLDRGETEETAKPMQFWMKSL